MPIYEYGCKKCGDVIERIQKFSDPPLEKHDGCGGQLTKLISQSSFHLKGSGWYVTDYARKKSGESGTEGDVQKETANKPDADSSGKKAKTGEDAKGQKPAEKSGSESAKDPK